MPPALALRNLTVSVRGKFLVHGIDLTVDPGERVALLGASGSGKSLTAAAVLGSLGPEFRASGSLTLFGVPVDVGSTAARRTAMGIAAVYQDSRSALNPLVTIAAQLTLAVRRHHELGARAARACVAELLASVGIDDPPRTMAGYAAQLSGGQLQRVCIALALACRARLLIADEPTTALDVVNQARVLDVLRDYGDAERAAILFITHDLAVAASLCDRAVVLQHGRVVEQAAMHDLIERPGHEYARALVASAAPRSLACA
ncbi:ABC transporter ATP-binding protein [Cryobacterium frigoriphilum]|uniref:ABC transporter ATP-binding protein n=1 Tax=Cryobacterium frigoriphilum TaxID=1259150 RepID=A0A4R9A933_9MICO|nr:ABC transporter ATP-binding protein [Cryobacterium frigoriphilum]TFD54483.1 ABC transporter ATP-binding protein [Cryobacterium frigoriphilum]